ncbi:SAC3 family protein A isoform X2 [Salvia miltiorrhiza]|uniref:SAC3 family protein A isoform X2 n=1 Tax=Salvia miltiorrhiza TaxID=226208 RepID=UPI0025ACD7A9|nr:SAC3 family protein A isoform X2 [Salvia miltiorrhiza]
MMNQGENTETVAPVENQTIDQPQAPTSYFSPNCAVASWTAQEENHNLRENGAVSNSGYSHDQPLEAAVDNVQDGANMVSSVSTSSSGSTNVAQGYSGYATYPNADPYGYNSPGYAAYYNQYQQQSSQYQQQPNQYQQQPSQYQQQPNQYQQQPDQYQQQSSQYQPQTNQYQQQPNQSYPHHIGAYQNTGAPHQPLSSFQNTGSYAGPASYSSTYYNPGDYQTSGSYTSGTYGTQTNLWQGGQYASYGSHQYPNYSQDSNSAYSSSVATAQYQQQYKQWQDYYNQTQTEVSCAPGTENIPVPASSSVNSSTPSGNIGYTASNNQIPAAYTPSWRPESTSSELTSVQPVAVSESTSDGYWKHGTPAFQNDPSNFLQPHAQKPPEVISAYENFQNQQNSTYSQVSTSPYPASYPASYQVSQSHQTSFQTLPPPPEPLDSRKTSKLQIPTNPRIAPNLSMSVSKPNKDNPATTTAVKPAYISVATQQPNEKVVPQEEADGLKPAVFPNSLRGYVERALARCKNDRQKAACQAIMKEVITKATADGTLYTRDWDIEPLFPIPNTDAVDKYDTEFPVLTSATQKVKSPSRRVKSRWEPISEEKVADNKTSSMSFGTPKYGAWNNKQFSGGKIENKVSLGTKFSFTDQKYFNRNTARPAKRQRLGEDLNAADGGETSSDSDMEQNLTKYYSAAITLADTPEEKKKRENRSKRFDRGHGTRAEKVKLKAKDLGAGNLYARRASALILSKTFDESGSKAVEDIDWDALTVKGTCQEIEKRYLRLTSAPDPATVRPEEVLEKALEMVQNSQKNYLYKCDQLKSIRQDLTVQHIRNELTVKVYETHARLAIEVGDLPEYNQCQSQLKTLYAEGISGCHMEFAAYNLLCVILHSKNNRDLVSAMSRLPLDAKTDTAVKHALSVRSAVTSGNYVMFFRLYKTAPNLNTLLMDLYVEKMRYAAVKCISRSYRPTVPVSYISQILGFSSAMPTSEPSDEKEVEGVEECMEWLKAHGACLISDGSEEMLLDTKVILVYVAWSDSERITQFFCLFIRLTIHFNSQHRNLNYLRV